MTESKSCKSCTEVSCSAKRRKEGESEEEFAKRQKRAQRLCGIRRRLVVMSGKGGVGKSTVAVNLAVALAMKGYRTGLLDVDIHGPSVPTLLGMEGRPLYGQEEGLIPVECDGLKVISAGFLLRSPEDAVVWRGPMKSNIIRQFIEEVIWGELDYLVVDCPPGTGDEPLSVCHTLERVDGALIVTTPQKLAAVDVMKCINFCRAVRVPIVGLIENMSGFVCAVCKSVTNIFKKGGGRELSEKMGVPFLGSIPIDPEIVAAGDEGRPFVRAFPDSPATKEILKIVGEIENRFPEEVKEKEPREVCV
ncbi:Mrp/NBP35 family ATP-binding protein [Thermodesulforhabdus norvegica]|uniref:Iron-sulfur cluster carrier protein n=1 Tax=Thermodesulforhabdus norvegica TaxID=39841 RepID=A0A1I4VTH4_9BACT|nr:Mrp/NBP35 family ATP-binding protein [Thermodesulforhabdus norvegica]SFN04296.1 Chromosome partitioning ATPase, Mrp family, contains Fe-S cluster [Thermodesulforhabdus norvegica]